MTLSPFPRVRRTQKRSANVFDAVLKDFSGGIKAVENELSVNPKYSVIGDNILVDEDDGVSVRFGTRELATYSENIVEAIYFSGQILLVFDDGTISITIDGSSSTVIWNTAIANTLPGAPAGWSTGVNHIDFTIFKGDLIICNGTDKPLIVDNTFTVNYLQDIATGSNVNTPIAKFVTVVNNFVIFAAATNSSEIFISSSGTSGTWSGDPAPNDATSFDLATFTGLSGDVFRGIASFKNNLFCFMDDYVAVITLGTFDGNGDHVPNVLDILEDVSLLSHKSVLITETNMLFVSEVGLYNVVRNVFGGAFEPRVVTEDLGTDFIKMLTAVDVNNNKSFMLRDKHENRIFIFLDAGQATKDVYTARHSLNFKTFKWTTCSGWNYNTAVNTPDKRIYMFNDNNMYQYGNNLYDNEDYYADNITDVSEGDEISFIWELPWLDANKRVQTKQLQNITAETSGGGRFLIEVFVDNFYKDLDGNFTPALSMEFVAGNSSGYGVDAGGFGGGRRANDERFYRMPARFKVLKYRITGTNRERVKFSSLSMIYFKGNYR